jgi:hypothetical protein
MHLTRDRPEERAERKVWLCRDTTIEDRPTHDESRKAPGLIARSLRGLLRVLRPRDFFSWPPLKESDKNAGLGFVAPKWTL